jgi:hypothetical protein
MKFANATKFNRKSGEAEESTVSASLHQTLTGETVLFIRNVLGFPVRSVTGLDHPTRHKTLSVTHYTSAHGPAAHVDLSGARGRKSAFALDDTGEGDASMERS